MMSTRSWFLCVVFLGLFGCGDDEAPPSPLPADAGHDAGEDGGEPDAALLDYYFDTQALAPLAGPHQRRASGQDSLAFYGTDLGYTVHHGGELRIAFGDTHASEVRDYPLHDDAFGSLAFDMCPAGDEVDRFVAESADEGAPWWEHAAPALTFATSEPDVLDRIQLVSGGEQLSLSALQTPISVLSDGADRLIGMFQRSEPATCMEDGGDECPDDLECDTGLGTCPGIFPTPCVLGSEPGEEGSCSGDRECVEPGGYCVDLRTSVNDGSPIGRILSVVHRLHVGLEAQPGSGEFITTPWLTNKLMNSFSRVVRDFDEARAYGRGNDYRAPDGEQLERARILVWGRPTYVGSKANDRDAQLYLAMAPLPEIDGDGAPIWQPRYFAGLDEEQRPRFVAEQRDAVPLDLSGGHGDPSEPHDIINQMAVSWVEPLQRWAMLYGGDLDPGAADSYNPGWQRNEAGAIFARFAVHPWGPWSEPQVVLRAGDPEDPNGLRSEYRAGGVLYHPDCEGDGCIDGSPSTLYPDGFVQYGWLYGPNIIDCWTTPFGDHGAALYWNVSTWNPYEVVLMKTRIEEDIELTTAR